MRWTRIPWTILVATISSAQMQPDPTTGTGRPVPGPSHPDTVSVDSTGAAVRGATTNRAFTTSATSIVTLRCSDGIALATAREAASVRRATRIVPGDRAVLVTASDPVLAALATLAASNQSESAGGLWAELIARSNDRATVWVRRSADPFATTPGVDVRDASTFELERMDGVWRVRAWHEAVSGEPDATASVRADARVGRRDAPDPTGARDAAAATPSRLAIRARADRAHGTLAFDVALPEAGGAIELFDVAGRRIVQRDLGGLAPGVHRVAIDARDLGAGVYFARVRQFGAIATTRAGWSR